MQKTRNTQRRRPLMAIPKSMQAKYDEISALIIPYCDTYLNDAFKELCLHALEKLCRKRPSPLTSGRTNTWAAGIVYAICANNWIFDKSRPIHMTAEELASPFGVSKSTAGQKATEIDRLLKIDHFNAEWIIASDVENNPALWFVSVNGILTDARTLPRDIQIYCMEKGLIPYVPEPKDES